MNFFSTYIKRIKKSSTHITLIIFLMDYKIFYQWNNPEHVVKKKKLNDILKFSKTLKHSLNIINNFIHNMLYQNISYGSNIKIKIVWWNWIFQEQSFHSLPYQPLKILIIMILSHLYFWKVIPAWLDNNFKASLI